MKKIVLLFFIALFISTSSAYAFYYECPGRNVTNEYQYFSRFDESQIAKNVVTSFQELVNDIHTFYDTLTKHLDVNNKTKIFTYKYLSNDWDYSINNFDKFCGPSGIVIQPNLKDDKTGFNIFVQPKTEMQCVNILREKYKNLDHIEFGKKESIPFTDVNVEKFCFENIVCGKARGFTLVFTRE